MARNDWVALVTNPGAEYTAWAELLRFGLKPYLPQCRRQWRPAHGATSLLRKYPLFPRYILLPVGDAKPTVIRLCRGVRKLKPLLANDFGYLWRASDDVVAAVRENEEKGAFDELLAKGDKVTLAKGVLAGVQAVLTSTAGRGKVEMLMPLFGGVKATVPQANVARV